MDTKYILSLVVITTLMCGLGQAVTDCTIDACTLSGQANGGFTFAYSNGLNDVPYRNAFGDDVDFCPGVNTRPSCSAVCTDFGALFTDLDNSVISYDGNDVNCNTCCDSCCEPYSPTTTTTTTTPTTHPVLFLTTHVTFLNLETRLNRVLDASGWR